MVFYSFLSPLDAFGMPKHARQSFGHCVSFKRICKYFIYTTMFGFGMYTLYIYMHTDVDRPIFFSSDSTGFGYYIKIRFRKWKTRKKSHDTNPITFLDFLAFFFLDFSVKMKNFRWLIFAWMWTWLKIDNFSKSPTFKNGILNFWVNCPFIGFKLL